MGGTLNIYSFASSQSDNQGERQRNSFNNIRLVPYIGIQTNERWMFGLQGGFYIRHYSISEISNISRKSLNKYSTYYFGALARRFYMEGKPLRFYLESGLLYAKFRYKPDNPSLIFNTVMSSKEISAYLSPGVMWTVNDHFRILARFGKLRYLFLNATYKDYDKPVKSSQFDLLMNAETLTIGAEVRL